jgi:hypothetical protein
LFEDRFFGVKQAFHAGAPAVPDGGAGEPGPRRVGWDEDPRHASKHKAMSYSRMKTTEPALAANDAQEDEAMARKEVSRSTPGQACSMSARRNSPEDDEWRHSTFPSFYGRPIDRRLVASPNRESIEGKGKRGGLGWKIIEDCITTTRAPTLFKEFLKSLKIFLEAPC